MSRIAYVNGRYVPHAAARVHIEDRGYQFADGVYEVIAAVRGRFVDGGVHLDRLERSLAALQIAMPMERGALEAVLSHTARCNRVGDGIVYLQVSRGVARRDHAYPPAVRAAVVVTARRHRLPAGADDIPGVTVVSTPDLRWGRCDIKSISLLPNVIAKQQAVASGAFEAWLVDREGFVTEGSASNSWIVDSGNRLVTRPKGPEILGGITRERLIELARAADFEVVERAFSVAEAKGAREAFVTSTTSFLRPVVGIDGAVVGNGEPGPVSRKLLALYLAYAGGE